ncbi:MAG: hypothetical protein WA001_03630 [Patescibacteria group bacterium]
MDENRTEWLPRSLTDEDVRARGDDLARVLGEIDREEADKAAAAKAAAGRIKRLASESNTLAREIRERKTWLEVEVESSRNLEAGTIDTVRTDTGEVIRARPMTPEERQVSIDDHPRRKRGKVAEGEAGE